MDAGQIKKERLENQARAKQIRKERRKEQKEIEKELKDSYISNKSEVT